MIQYKRLKLNPVLIDGKIAECDKDALSIFIKDAALKVDQDYINFLFEYNGGDIAYPQKAFFYIAAKRRKKRALSVLYPFATGNRWQSINGMWEDYIKFYPRVLLPMGYDDHDGAIIMGAGGDIAGKIFVLHTQVTELTPESTEVDILNDKGVFKVADSFTEFIDKLEIVDN